jgi:hypothetical protein
MTDLQSIIRRNGAPDGSALDIPEQAANGVSSDPGAILDATLQTHPLGRRGDPGSWAGIVCGGGGSG